MEIVEIDKIEVEIEIIVIEDNMKSVNTEINDLKDKIDRRIQTIKNRLREWNNNISIDQKIELIIYNMVIFNKITNKYFKKSQRIVSIKFLIILI